MYLKNLRVDYLFIMYSNVIHIQNMMKMLKKERRSLLEFSAWIPFDWNQLLLHIM